MFMHDQPVALDLPVHVGDPNGEVNRLAFGVCATHTLNAMAEAHCSIDRDAQIAYLEFQWPLECANEVRPILTICLGTNILAWWNHVEHHEAFVGHIDLHDGVDILGADSSHKSGLKCPD